MNVMLNRLDPKLPNPVESRRRAAGRFVRIAYSTVVFGLLAFFVIYFGRPLVYLGGPGTVSSPRFVVSLPYIVQVNQMNVTPGAVVQAGEEIGRVRSPQQDSIVATYMRALADIAGRRADLRIKARVAQDSLESARSYLQMTEKAADHVEGSAVGSLAFRLEMVRERAAAQKAVVSYEAEAAEATTQIASLNGIYKEVRAHLEEVERNFAGGRIFAPIAGIVSTNLANLGQSLVAGTPIAEILDQSDVFVDWYIPNERFRDPKVGNEVLVLFGNRRIPGQIVEVLPVSDVYASRQQSITRERVATQIARVRFSPGTEPPPLNSTVYVHMHYTDLASRTAAGLVSLFGLQ